MKQSLQIRLGQHIAMTPQLQQAIRLLQLSTTDLQMEIQQVLDSNIMLEMAEEDDYEIETEDEQDLDLDQNNDIHEDEEEFNVSSPDLSNDSDDEINNENEMESNTLTDIPQELLVDSNWEEVYGSTFTQYDYSNGDSNEKESLLSQESISETLQDHLQWQLDLTPFNDLDRAIATVIIDSIDSDGYLRASLEDIIPNLGKGIRVSKREIEIVLHRIQHFDPVGVGARNLSECLLLQLSEYDSNTPWLKEAQKIIRKYLELLAIHDYAQLATNLRLTYEELQQVINLIQSLSPRPGAKLDSSQTNYVIPDVFVKKVNDMWKVELNQEMLPKVRINPYYASLVSQMDNNEEQDNLRNHLQEARWFLKSLKSRQETLLKVAKCVVKCQSAFLSYGEEAMKPLVLHDVARELEMHESTVSRVTTQKYLLTPRGIFELKYFFSSHVKTINGQEYSSTAIRAMIKRFVATEDATRPLSDSRIAELLSERGINVARRTVAKYREAMIIPSSNERKRLL